MRNMFSFRNAALSTFFTLLSTFVFCQNNALTLDWLEPADKQPVRYEKMEWTIHLPDQISKAIKNWVSNDKFKTHLLPAINPFDPEQIDLKAEITYTTNNKTVRQPVFGYFQRDYERVTGSDDPNQWTWQEITHDKVLFHIRWSPEFCTEHRAEITLHVPGYTDWKIEPFTFTVRDATPANSFIRVSDNKHFFSTADGKIYMPIGLNITEGTYSCSCKEGVWAAEDCNECYQLGSEDPCCGIDVKKKQRYGNKGTTLMEYTSATAAYLKMERVLQDLKAAGGNAFRTFMDPVAYDIEFEKMNNYYDRQYQAFEFDQLLETCHDLDLRMELNLQFQYSINYHSFGADRFDWDDNFNCIGCGKDYNSTGTSGWCYKNDCPEVETPIDFLSNECAIKNYQKKIRYIIARWGYSRNIFLIDLMSEINSVGQGSTNEVNIDTDGDGQKDDYREVFIPSQYKEDPANRLIVAAWHHEMGRFIKEDLQHHRHLISADFAGQEPMSTDLNHDGDCLDAEIGENCNPCQSKYFDYSWMSPYIDVLAFSNYTGSLNRWERMADQEYYPNEQSNGLMCGWNNPKTTDDDEGYHSPLGGYESLWKPVVHAENGFAMCMEGDYTGFSKDLLTDIINGHATSGMSWDEWSETTHWGVMGVANRFLQTHVYASANPAQGNWRPGHEYSYNKSDKKKTRFAEVVYLTNTETGYTYGVVMNRSWNHFTTGTGNCLQEDKKSVFGGDDEPLSRLTTVDSETERMHVSGVLRGKYNLSYINPNDNQVIKTVQVRSNSRKLPLDDFPSLNSASNGDFPYFFFVVSKPSDK